MELPRSDSHRPIIDTRTCPDAPKLALIAGSQGAKPISINYQQTKHEKPRTVYIFKRLPY